MTSTGQDGTAARSSIDTKPFFISSRNLDNSKIKSPTSGKTGRKWGTRVRSGEMDWNSPNQLRLFHI
jgi:hypothetical protein